LEYVAGNHDEYSYELDSFKHIYTYPYKIINVDDQVWYIEHGHLIGQNAWVFQILDIMSEIKCFHKLSRWLTKTKILSEIGRKEDPEFSYKACQRAKKYGANVAIIGHTHVAEKKYFEDLDVMYINPGCALTEDVTYFVWDNGEFSLEKI
jgi:predicted phosphodiesterase